MSTQGRRRKPLWRRRRVWIVVLAVGAAIVLTLWLIRNVGDYRPPSD